MLPSWSTVTLNPAGHQDLQAIVHAPRFPSFVRETEFGLAATQGLGVDAQDRLEISLDLAEHLEDIHHPDGLLRQPQVLTQGGYTAYVHPGDGCAAKVQRHTLRWLVLQGAQH